MASGTFIAGKNARISVNGTSYRFRNWRIRMRATRIDVTNFHSIDATGAFREFLAGFMEGTLSCSGPHDPTLPVVQQGDTVAFVAQIGTGYLITGNCVITDIDLSQDIEKAAELGYEGAITGPVQLSLAG